MKYERSHTGLDPILNTGTVHCTLGSTTRVGKSARGGNMSGVRGNAGRCVSSCVFHKGVKTTRGGTGNVPMKKNTVDGVRDIMISLDLSESQCVWGLPARILTFKEQTDSPKVPRSVVIHVVAIPRLIGRVLN